jgi:tRNA1(Val) A37 N6-methylase TrmN6
VEITYWEMVETQSRREGMESESVEAAPWEMQVMVLAREVQEMLMEVKVFMGLLEVQ